MHPYKRRRRSLRRIIEGKVLSSGSDIGSAGTRAVIGTGRNKGTLPLAVLGSLAGSRLPTSNLSLRAPRPVISRLGFMSRRQLPRGCAGGPVEATTRGRPPALVAGRQAAPIVDRAVELLAGRVRFFPWLAVEAFEVVNIYRFAWLLIGHHFSLPRASAATTLTMPSGWSSNPVSVASASASSPLLPNSDAAAGPRRAFPLSRLTKSPDHNPRCPIDPRRRDNR